MNSNFKTSQARKEVRKEILNWSSKKATKIGDIPSKILKKSVDIYLKETTFIIYDCIENGIFPDDLKLADVSPMFDFKKANYRPVSILPHMSKVFERILSKQIHTFMTTKFSPYLRSIFNLENDRNLERAFG